MRVLVAAEAFESIAAQDVGSALAQAWAARGATVAVVPMAGAGDLAGPLAHLWDAGIELVATEVGPITVVAGDDEVLISAALPAKQGIDQRASSGALGRVVQGLGEQYPAAHLVLEVIGGAWHDGGRGWLEAWGGLEAARSRFDGRHLRLVVSAVQAGVPLTGLRGITSLDGRGDNGGPALDTTTLVRIDTGLAQWAQTLAVDPTVAGSGAVGGLGAAVASVGGTVTTAPALIAELTHLDDTLARSDLVVTGTEQLDFGSMGGEVLADLIERARRHLVPLISVSGRNHISPRELRSIGVEAAYSVLGETGQQAATQLTADDITEAAGPVAQTWSW